MNGAAKPHLLGMVAGLLLAAGLVLSACAVTKDARARGGRGIGGLQTADMGVIQIAAIYSGQTSWEGMNDTSSLDKTITAVVTATFALK